MSRARDLSGVAATLTSVQSMIDGAGKGATLRDVMSDPSSANRFLQRMQSDGLISSQERPQYLDGSDGGMTEEGKRLFERALLGSAVGDSYLMDAAPKSTLAKLSSSIGPLSSLAARGDEWNILPEVRRAIQEHSRMATTGMNVDDHFAQQGMFGNDTTPAEEQMTRVLAKNPTAVREAFASFAKDARQSPEGQSSLLGMSGPTPEDAWIKAFGPILQRGGKGTLQDAPITVPLPTKGSQAGDGLRGMAAYPQASLSIPPLMQRPGLVARPGSLTRGPQVPLGRRGLSAYVGGDAA